MLPAAEQVLQELEEEARANWEERAIYQATQVTNLAGEAFETLSENRWSRRDCTEYQDELDWVMRTFQRVCDKLDLASMADNMRRMARARQERVNYEYQRATRVVERLLQAHGGRQEERRPPAGSGCRDGRKYRDEFNIEHLPEQRMEYEDSIPMERRPTLPVADVLSAEQQERSWESAPGSRWLQPAMVDRSRGIGDLGMADLNIGAPARLQRGGRALQPAGASTPLGGSSGELPRTYSGSSTRVDYRRRLELNTQDSDEDVLFRQEMRYPERGAGGFSGLRRAGAGESRASPPVQQLDVSEYLTASESASEQGRSRAGTEDTRRTGPVPVVRRSEKMPIRRNRSLLAAGEKIEIRWPAWVTTLGAASLGRAWRPTDHPGRRGIVQVHLCLPGDHRAYRFPGVVRAQQPRRDRYDSPPRGYGGAVPRQPQPQAGNWAGQPAPPIVGLGLEAMQGMTNAMMPLPIKSSAIQAGLRGMRAGRTSTARSGITWHSRGSSSPSEPTTTAARRRRSCSNSSVRCVCQRKSRRDSSRPRPWRLPGCDWTLGLETRACSSKI